MGFAIFVPTRHIFCAPHGKRTDTIGKFLRKSVDAFKSYRETCPKQTDRQMSNGQVKTENSLHLFIILH